MGACVSKEKNESNPKLNKKKKSKDGSSSSSSSDASMTASETATALTATPQSYNSDANGNRKHRKSTNKETYLAPHRNRQPLPVGDAIPHSPTPDDSFNSRVTDSVTISILDSPEKEDEMPTFIAGPLHKKKSTHFSQQIRAIELEDGYSQTEASRDIYDVHNYSTHDYRECVAELVVCRKLIDARRIEIEQLKEENEEHQRHIKRLNYKLEVFKELHIDTEQEFQRLYEYFIEQLKHNSDNLIFRMECDRAKVLLDKVHQENSTHAAPPAEYKRSSVERDIVAAGRPPHNLKQPTVGGDQSQSWPENVNNAGRDPPPTNESIALTQLLQTENGRLRDDVRRLEEQCKQLTDEKQEGKSSADKLQQELKRMEVKYRHLQTCCKKKSTRYHRTMTEVRDAHGREKTNMQKKLARANSNLETARAKVDVLNLRLQSEIRERKFAENRAFSARYERDINVSNNAGAAELASDKKHDEMSKEEKKAERKDERKVRSLERQLEHEKEENCKLQERLETLRQELRGKNKRLSLELKQTSECYEQDRTRMLAHTEQLMTDLNNARKQISDKNRENFELKERLTQLEGETRQLATAAKRAREEVSLEEKTREKLDKRNMELELLLASVRARGDVDATDEGHGEMQRLMSDFTKRLHETQRDTHDEDVLRERKRYDDVTRKLASLESALRQEQALHVVSKTQLQSYKDENDRLRENMSSLRRRLTASANDYDFDRGKSRAEEINELIAQSQNRARLLLSSAPLADDSLRLDTSSILTRNINVNAHPSPVPNEQYWAMTSTPRSKTGAVDADASLASDRTDTSHTS